MWRVLRAYPFRSVVLAAALTATWVFCNPVWAQDVCVVCNGPDAIYRCQPDGTALRSGDARIGLLCITELARAGGHASCSVQRQHSASCDGPLRTVSISSTPAFGPPPEAQDTAVATPQGERGNAGPPDTVAELAKRTANSSKDGLQKATDAVGDAAKKTTGAVGDAAKKSWRCVTSLFQECK